MNRTTNTKPSLRRPPRRFFLPTAPSEAARAREIARAAVAEILG